jgi:anti-sigma-K factor RskA
MSAPHDELKVNAAGYVLGSLDADERRLFEAHLAECDECATEVSSLRPIVGVLATAVPQVTPRAEVRARVLGRSAPAVVPQRSVSWLPIAAAVVLAVGAAMYVARVQRQHADLQSQLAQAQAATAVLVAPDLARIDLQGQTAAPDAMARALWSRTRGLVFTVTNLPALPAGKVYQVWVVTAQAPVSAGLLVPDTSGGGTVYYMTPPDIAPPVAVAVTLESAGGVAAPTGDRYLVGAPTPGV